MIISFLIIKPQIIYFPRRIVNLEWSTVVVAYAQSVASPNGEELLSRDLKHREA